jgi:hypothetical protein
MGVRVILLIALAAGLGAWHCPANVITNAGSGYWTNGATWGGSVPGATDDVVVRSGYIITNDGATASVKSLTLNGTITHSSNGTNDQGYRVDITASDFILVATGGAINVNSKGYAGGTNGAGLGRDSGSSLYIQQTE